MKKIRIVPIILFTLLCALGINSFAQEQKIDISKQCVIQLKTSKDYVYTGKEIKPAVVVTYSEKVDGNVVEKNLKSKTDYTISYGNNIKAGTAKIIVRGNGNYEGEISTTFEIKLAAPTTVIISPSYNANKLSWSGVKGAQGYRIYRSTSKSSGFKQLADVNATSKAYTDKKVSCGKTYYYQISAFYKKEKVEGLSSKVKGQKVQPAKTTITKITRQDTKVLKITWKKVSGASGYGIYRSTSKNGKYTRVGTVKDGKVSFLDKKCSFGKTYYYKVLAYRALKSGNCYGSASDPKGGYTQPAKVAISGSTTYNSTKITLKWKKAAGATGYQICQATGKGGSYKLVKTISSNKTVSWTKKSLKKGVVYYYKIRSYCEINGKTVYGPWSDTYKKTKAGWRYVDGYKLYYNTSGKLVKDVSGIIGKQENYVIKVNKKQNTVTVYAKDGKNGYIIPVKAFICSTGYATPIGTFYTPQKYRWHELMGPCWGQWCTRITGGILFHSVWYRSKNNNNTLSTSAYNKLGTTASHGCVRLTAGDAKWIYDNCDLKTKVVIYNSSNPGPLGKPKAHKLKSSHTWDPTDPNMKAKCKKKGCH